MRVLPAMFIYPFHATSLFLYTLKISENVSFYDVFKGVWIEISGMKWANAKDGFVVHPSVCPSFRLSVIFFRLGSLVFSKI